MRVATIGTFDLLHDGHRNLIDFCLRIAGGSPVVVGVNTDEFVARYKSARPAQQTDERVRAILRAYPGEVVRQHDGATDVWLAMFAPKVLVVGSDWATRDYRAQLGVTQKWLDAHDIAVCYRPRTPGISSTQLREELPRDVNDPADEGPALVGLRA